MQSLESLERYCESNITAGYVPGGKARNIPASGLAIVEFLEYHGILCDGDHILDVGCGNGRLAMGLFLSTLTNYTYHGLDIIKPVIEFCKAAFKEQPAFNFTHLDIYNQHYWPIGKIQVEDAIFPVEEESIDVAIGFSLFTHMASIEQAQHYLAEILRTIKPGGKLFCTWSFTTIRDNVAINEKHTIWHFNQVMDLLSNYSFEFLPLYNGRFKNWYKFTGAPNQVGVIITKAL